MQSATNTEKHAPGIDLGGRPAAEPPVKKSFFRRRRAKLVAAVIVLAVATYGLKYWLHARQYEETDDAFVDGSIVQISSRVAGQILSVEAEDNQDVATGAVLVRLDARDSQARLDQANSALAAARARLAQANTQVELMKADTAAALDQAQGGLDQARAAVDRSKAEQAYWQQEVNRRAELIQSGAVAQNQYDTSRLSLNTAQAALAESTGKVVSAQAALATAQTAPQQIAAAEAQAASAKAAMEQAAAAVAAAELDLSYTVIRAPVDGRITRKIARAGQYVQVGQIVTALVQPEVWVTANFKETQLTHMSAGQDVTIVVDAYPGQAFHGAVDSIQAGTGARFSLLPPENATGNYVKVVQRVPVKILFDREAYTHWLLAPGMSVVPSVYVGAGRGEHPLPIRTAQP
jgi:membrane fusion protein (multidrug efflux system)